MSALNASYWLWGIWYVIWWAAALLASKAKSRPKDDGGLFDRAVAGLGIVLLFLVPLGRGGLTRSLWSKPALIDWLCVAGVALGFIFCCWARIHLGKLWSGLVTVKADHRIIETGPYGLVRHPIYSGLTFSAVCEALLKASLPALAGAVLIGAGFALTARKEEKFLRLQLGLDHYNDYARRVGMLFPKRLELHRSATS